MYDLIDLLQFAAIIRHGYGDFLGASFNIGVCDGTMHQGDD